MTSIFLFRSIHVHRRFLVSAILLAFVVSSLRAQQHGGPSARIDAGFRTPPSSAQPWVFWMWLRVKTSHAAITADLEEMHAKGIEGAILYDSGVGGGMEATRRMVPGDHEYRQVPTDDFLGAHFTPIPEPAMPSWQPESRERIRWASREAGRLGVKLVVSVGLASTSGDIPLEYGQQRLVWSELDVDGGSAVRDILPVPNRAASSSFKSFKSVVPENDNFGSHPEDQHMIAVLAVPAREGFQPADVIDLTGSVDATGHLTWSAPAGKWTILRFAYEPTRMANAWGLYTDAMSAEALDRTWELDLGKLLDEMSPQERRGMYGVEDDSWEAGTSTWTRMYPQEFKARRGYDLLQWLPVLANKAMGSEADRLGIRRDYYRTTADLIAEKHYTHLGDLARRNHLVFYSEAAGPNSGQLDPEQDFAEVDVPMGEVWMPSQHRPTQDRRFLMRDAASGGHVYGKRILGCEIFTSVGPHWEETFFDMKNTGDQGFTDGCNKIAIHNFSQSPSVTAKPGYAYFAGTHYGRNVTWWNETPAFNAYLGRISFLLQQGFFVADALYFRGDAIGQVEQRKTSPSLPAPGYDHDNINLDALLHRLSVHNGRLTLPDGMSYGMLVLPDQSPMAPEALAKIVKLARAGAIVVGRAPSGPVGLILSEETKRTFEANLRALWNQDSTDLRLGAGRVLTASPADALQLIRLAPDFTFTGLSSRGDIDWIHRRSGTTDLYFITSRWDPAEKISATFRVSGRQPELWNPVTGEIREAKAFSQSEGRTTVPLEFDPRGSVFVVFRKPIAKNASGIATSNYPTFIPLRQIEGPWQVSFDPRWGGPENIIFSSLTDWTKRPETNIQHYSGTAIYRKSFELAGKPTKQHPLFLNLGEVHEIASVRLNGVELGVVWTKPARIELTAAARRGNNRLEVSVVNLWPNRLIGDESLPQAQRLTETNVHKFSARTPLFASGLDGPVTLEEHTEDSD